MEITAEWYLYIRQFACLLYSVKIVTEALIDAETHGTATLSFIPPSPPEPSHKLSDYGART